MSRFRCIQYINRESCANAGVHTARFAGIHGSKPNGAYSVCLSGGYEDTDEGESLYVVLPLGVCSIYIRFFPSIYTGTGGQMNSFSVSVQKPILLTQLVLSISQGDHTQVEDQSFDHRSNAWLMVCRIFLFIFSHFIFIDVAQSSKPCPCRARVWSEVEMGSLHRLPL